MDEEISLRVGKGLVEKGANNGSTAAIVDYRSGRLCDGSAGSACAFLRFRRRRCRDVAIGRPDSEASCTLLVETATQGGRALDILVAASGTSKIKSSLDMALSELENVMDANVRQSWLTTRAAGRAMIEGGNGGKIVLVSSVRGRFATAAGTSAYGPSKAAVDMLTKSFATEWGRHGINVGFEKDK